jgi:hypothetical protein
LKDVSGARKIVPNYLVEHSITGAGELSSPELLSIAQQCTLALDELEAQILWLYSVIVADRMVGFYVAEDETVVRELARQSGLPIQRISEVSAVIGPIKEENYADILNEYGFAGFFKGQQIRRT